MNKQKFKNIIKEIKKYETIIIHRHVRGDIDCIGSQNALKNIIKQQFPKKEVYAVGEEVRNLLYLGKMDNIKSSKYDGALVIILDTANRERIDGINYLLGKKTIKIDHHPTIDEYADINFSNDSYAATAEMIVDLAEFAKWKISPLAAKNLFAGIVGDTGRFMFRNVSEKTFSRTSLLMKINPCILEVYDEMYKRSHNEIKFEAYVLSNFSITAFKTAYIKIPTHILNKFNITTQEVSSFIRLLAHIEGIKVWCLFYEDIEKKQIRGSLRSKNITINHIASKFGGGGHKFASGVTLSSFSEVDALIAKIDEELRNKI